MTNGSIECISLNIRGIRNTRKRKRCFRAIKDRKTDIICLQETYVTDDVIEQWKRDWGGELLFFEGTNHGKGLVILIRKGFPFNFTIELREDRILAVRIKAEKDIVVYNVYAPCERRETVDFFKYLEHTINECEADFKILCGDFNAVLCNDKDIISGRKHPTSLVEAFNNLLDECELSDVWRIFNESKKEYSWSRTTINSFIARRLDYILLNENALGAATHTQLISFPSTDHRAVSLTLNIAESKRGPGYYKFNNSLLNDSNFITEMNMLIRTFLHENVDNDPIMTLELLKIKTRETAIQYSKRKATAKRNQLAKLYCDLNTLEVNLANTPNCQELKEKVARTKIQLEIIEQERLKSAQVRSKIKYIAEGDKSTKFFLNLEKSKANAKLFPNIELEDGRLVTNQHDIRNTQREFYKNLYSTEDENNLIDNNINNFLRDSIIPTLSDIDRNSCEGQITIEEATEALKNMNNGSAPGPDGLTTEFYKIFWKEIRDIVIKSFNSSFNTGSLSFTQTSAILTLLHKGKDLAKNKLQNWRPISLTNTDYKILAKCLANRVNKVIENIISEDQVGYIKGRNVSTILRTIDDLIEYWNLKNKPGILLALDFQKAFDTISKNYMLSAFKKFGFGPDLQQWVKVLFANTRSSIIYNGWISEDFEVKCGIRQGCPFSPLAFIIGVELLAIRIRDNRNIKGLEIDTEKILKVLMYADDITLFLKDNYDVRLILLIIDNFTEISGLKLNKHKSEAMGIGTNKRLRNLNAPKCVDEIKILGIYYSNSKCASENENNWVKRIQQMKRLIISWEKRNVGIIGKVCIAKSLLLSQLVYASQAIYMPDKILKEINTLLYRFLWRKKDCNRRAFEKVKRTVLNSDIEKGGLKMIDFKTMQESFICERIAKLIRNENESKWTWIPRLHLKYFGKDYACLASTVGPKKFKGIEYVQSFYWKRAVLTWLKLNNAAPFFKTNNICIWNNTNITNQNNVLWFDNWVSKLTYVNDIVQNGSVLPFHIIETTLGHSPNRYLEYIVVYNAITRYLNRGHQDRTTQECLLNEEKLDAKTITAKIIRNYINNHLYTTPCSTRFWLNKFNYNVTEAVWVLAWNTTKEVRLRELQWKLLHNIYPTNILLLKMGLANNNKCSLCRLEIDYIEHFFFTCPVIKYMWVFVEGLFRQHFKINVLLNEQNVLFGITEKEANGLIKSDLKTVNHILLIAKMCISKYRYGNPINLVAMIEQEMSLRNIDFSK